MNEQKDNMPPWMQGVRIEGIDATDTETEPLDRWSMCVLIAGRMAHAKGKLEDSEHVKQIAYDLYEGGAFKEQQPA